MAVNINSVWIGGNLTRDPQVKFLANEQAVANFGIAVNETWKSKDGEKKENTTFVEIEVWGKTAELCGQYLTKGQPVLVEGKLTQSTYEKDGQKITKTRVKGERVHFLGGKGEKATSGTQGQEKSVKSPPNATSEAPIGGGASDQDPPFAPFDMPV